MFQRIVLKNLKNSTGRAREYGQQIRKVCGQGALTKQGMQKNLMHWFGSEVLRLEIGNDTLASKANSRGDIAQDENSRTNDLKQLMLFRGAYLLISPSQAVVRFEMHIVGG